MTDARYSSDDYAAVAQASLPTGRVWSLDPASIQGRLMRALATSYQRADQAGTTLLAGALPGDNPDLLSEWEASLGLPDPCAGPDPTAGQRRAQVRARFVGGGGQNRGRFIDFAATLGFTITIRNYAPFRAGRSTCGNACSSNAWTFVWGIHVIASTGGLSADVLLCELDTIKPAETTILLLS